MASDQPLTTGFFHHSDMRSLPSGCMEWNTDSVKQVLFTHAHLQRTSPQTTENRNTHLTPSPRRPQRCLVWTGIRSCRLRVFEGADRHTASGRSNPNCMSGHQRHAGGSTCRGQTRLLILSAVCDETTFINETWRRRIYGSFPALLLHSH